MRACPSAHRPPMSQSGNIKRAANLHLAPITVSCPSHRPISSHYRPMWIPGKFLRPNLFNPIVPIWPGSFSVSVIITINKNAQLIKQGCGDGNHYCFFFLRNMVFWHGCPSLHLYLWCLLKSNEKMCPTCEFFWWGFPYQMKYQHKKGGDRKQDEKFKFMTTLFPPCNKTERGDLAWNIES